MEAISQVRRALPAADAAQTVAPEPKGTSFTELLQQLGGGREFNINGELERVVKAAEQGRSIPFSDLIRFQVAASQFGLRVELLSKTAESAVATARRLQSPQ